MKVNLWLWGCLGGRWPCDLLVVALAFLEEFRGAGGAGDIGKIAWVDKLAPLILACVAVVGALGSAVNVGCSGAVAIHHFDCNEVF